MTDQDSLEYYAARESRERALAQAATDPAIAAVHDEMARRYSNIIGSAVSTGQLVQLDLQEERAGT